MWKKIITKSVFILALSCQSFFTTPAKAESLYFDALYVFGDSLVDAGNLYNLTGGIFPPGYYYSSAYPGRFSNGQVWTDYLAEYLEISLPVNFYPNQTVIPPEGFNFAVAGATTGENGLSLIPFTGLQAQLNYYLNLLDDNYIDPQDLYVLSIAANDYLGYYYKNLLSNTPDPNAIINNIITSLQQLAGKGAKNILINNLLDLGNIPLTSNLTNSQELTDLSQQHNNLLEQKIAELKQLFPHTNFIVYNLTIIDTILAAPEDYGFITEANSKICTNIKDFPVLPAPDLLEICSNPDEYFFWDNQHPTTRAHQFIADDVFKTLKNSGASGKIVTEPKSLVVLLIFGWVFLSTGQNLKKALSKG